MKRFYFILTFATLLTAINIAPACAQGSELAEAIIPESNYKGNGITIDDAAKSERVVFFNVGNKKFLNAGGLWGTEAATHTAGLFMKLEEKSTGKYYIHTPFFGEGQYFGYVSEGGDNKEGVFLDRRKDDTYPKTATVFTFTKVEVSEINDSIKKECSISNGDNIYKIQLLYADNRHAISEDQDLVANQQMRVYVFNDGNPNRVDIQQSTTNTNIQYTYWKIVNMDEIERTMLQDTHIYDTEPSDVTFLIRAQNFNRQNAYTRDVTNKEDLPKDDSGWHHDFAHNSLYTTKFNADDYTIRDITFNNETHGDGKYGMFYCAQIKNAGSYTVEKDKSLYQTVPVTKAGWYRIDCQGFFYNNGGTESCCAKLFAYSDKTATEGTAKHAYVNLLPQRYLVSYPHKIYEDKTDNSSFDKNTNIKNLYGRSPTTHLEAGIAFYTNEYPNSVLVYVPVAPANITFGIKATRDFTNNDVVWVDNFNMKYLGQSFALDERGKLTSPLDNGETKSKIEYTNRPMILRRTLNKGVWNPIVLPVNLTKYQVNTTFFPYPLIAEFKGFKDDHTLLFKILDLDDTVKFKDENVVAMEAGHCYLINAGYEGHSGSIKIGDENGASLKGPYYVIDRVTYKEETPINRDVETPTWAGKDCELSIVGTYRPAPVPPNSFLMDNSTLWHTNAQYTARGYSWWIEDAHQKGNPAQAHLFTFGAMNGEYDEVTGLYEVKIYDGGHSHHNGKVYNLQGIEMNGNAALPKGIYISNGKKFIVK